MIRRRHHVAAAVGLLVGQACEHGHPAAVPAQRPAPETLPALDTATYADDVPVTTTTTTTVPVAPVAAPVAATTTTTHVHPTPTTEPAPMGERTVRGAGTSGLLGCIAHYESGDGAGSNNIYQFEPSTWRSIGGTGYAGDASRAEQTMRAQMLIERDGVAGPWAAQRGRCF